MYNEDEETSKLWRGLMYALIFTIILYFIFAVCKKFYDMGLSCAKREITISKQLDDQEDQSKTKLMNVIHY